MTDIINIDSIQNKLQGVAQQIVDEQDDNKTKQLVAMFNANQQKKNVVRVMKLNELIDKIVDQIQERIEKRGDELTSQELLQCLQTITNTVEKANKDLNGIVDAPIITYAQNNINVNVTDSLSRESREKITSVVRDILDKANQMQYPILDKIETTEVVDD